MTRRARRSLGNEAGGPSCVARPCGTSRCILGMWKHWFRHDVLFNSLVLRGLIGMGRGSEDVGCSPRFWPPDVRFGSLMASVRPRKARFGLLGPRFRSRKGGFWVRNRRMGSWMPAWELPMACIGARMQRICFLIRRLGVRRSMFRLRKSRLRRPQVVGWGLNHRVEVSKRRIRDDSGGYVARDGCAALHATTVDEAFHPSGTRGSLLG